MSRLWRFYQCGNLGTFHQLVAENRVWLTANDPKLSTGFAACVALATAGLWRDKYPLFLLIPLVVVFLGLILLFQLDLRRVAGDLLLHITDADIQAAQQLIASARLDLCI